jgi:cob(I)alamin adenosyltransferase
MPVKKRKALTLVYTGNGKGKTTAALGAIFRAWGRDWSVAMLSFIKTETSNYGEERAARKLGIELTPLGAGFTWLSKDLEKDRALARRCWELCVEKIQSAKYDLVVLDEITYPINYGWLDLEEVLQVLRDRPPDIHVILTGREAPAGLVDFADLVTEMREIKHPFQKGEKAQPGIDF